MELTRIHWQRHKQVATITLNRPECHNAFDDVMLHELQQVLTDIQADRQLHVVVLQASGKSFSAGADAGWMQRMSQYSYQQNIEDAQVLADVMASLAHLPQVTLAVVQGPAFGGGVGLVACCDMVLATPSSRFCLSEVKLGLVPAVISPYVVQAIGIRATQYYALTAESFDAERAQHLGLVTEIVPADALALRRQAIIDSLCHNGPQALRACKRLLQQLSEPMSFNDKQALTVQTIAQLRVSPEGQEGLQAFLQKRPANWSSL